MSRKPVRDREGNRYLLLKRSKESSLVRDIETGERKHLPNETLDTLDGETTLDLVLAAIPETVRRVLTAVHDERSLGLLLEIDAEGPIAVRTLMSAYDFCESDLHGLLGELYAAGLIAEVEVTGERGYETTPEASDAIEFLQGDRN